MFNGKIHYKWWFSIAMLNYQRVDTKRGIEPRKRGIKTPDLAKKKWFNRIQPTQSVKKIDFTNENSDMWTHQKIAPSKNEDSSRHLFEFWEEAKKKGGYSNNDDIPCIYIYTYICPIYPNILWWSNDDIPSFMVINIDQLTSINSLRVHRNHPTVLILDNGGILSFPFWVWIMLDHARCWMFIHVYSFKMYHDTAGFHNSDFLAKADFFASPNCLLPCSMVRSTAPSPATS